MAQHTEKGRLSQPWFIRRIFYLAIGIIGAALFALGIADTAQIEEWTAAAERLAAPALMILTSVLAAPKANPGSDQGVSAPDPAPAVPQPETRPAPTVGNDLLAQLREQIARNRG